MKVAMDSINFRAMIEVLKFALRLYGALAMLFR